MVHQQSRPNHPPKWFLPDWSESVPDEDYSLKKGDYYEDQLAVSAKHHAAARNGRYNAIAGGSQPISTPANSSAVLHGGPERSKMPKSDNISSKEILVELPATRRRGRPRYVPLRSVPRRKVSEIVRSRKGRKNGDQRPDVEASAIEKGTIKGAEKGKTKYFVPRASSIKMPWVVVTSTMGANIWPDTPTPATAVKDAPLTNQSPNSHQYKFICLPTLTKPLDTTLQPIPQVLRQIRGPPAQRIRGKGQTLTIFLRCRLRRQDRRRSPSIL